MRLSSFLFLAIQGCDAGGVTIDIKGTPLVVEIADDPGERAKGLMYRDDLPADHGMLFAYPKDEPRHFWMKNTRIPLSIAFLSADGTVL